MRYKSVFLYRTKNRYNELLLTKLGKDKTNKWTSVFGYKSTFGWVLKKTTHRQPLCWAIKKTTKNEEII